MKNKNRLLALLAVLAASIAALATTAYAADNLREGNPVMSYTSGSGAYGTPRPVHVRPYNPMWWDDVPTYDLALPDGCDTHTMNRGF